MVPDVPVTEESQLVSEPKPVEGAPTFSFLTKDNNPWAP